MGGLVGDELAGVWRCPVLVPVDGERPGSLLAELALVGAAEVLVLVVHVEVPGKLLVVVSPVEGLLAVPSPGLVALNPPVDDVDGGAEARVDAVPPVDRVGYPGPVNDVQHAGLWRLRGHVEPSGGCEVEPSVSHEVRMV